MKKVFAVLAIAGLMAFASCKKEETTTGGDSTATKTDVVTEVSKDTTAPAAGDSTAPAAADTAK